MNNFAQFKQMMKKAKKGQRICYHRGSLIDDRLVDGELDMIAKFCVALWTINTARIWQQRENGECCYYIALTRRLRVRKDDQGSFQDAERLKEIV